MRQPTDLVDFHVWLREGGPRIPRSMPGAVHTLKSGHYSHGPLYLASCVRLRWQLEEVPHFPREGVPTLLCAMPGSDSGYMLCVSS